MLVEVSLKIQLLDPVDIVRFFAPQTASVVVPLPSACCCLVSGHHIFAFAFFSDGFGVLWFVPR